MARDFIKVDRTVVTATHATLLLEYVRALRNAYEIGTRVKAIMLHNHDGSNFTDIEALFGLPATKGQVVFDLINGSIGSMEGAFQVDDAKEITERVG
jgi:hypothetical protein